MQVVKRFYKIIVVTGFCLQTLAVTGLYAQNNFPAIVGKKDGSAMQKLEINQTKRRVNTGFQTSLFEGNSITNNNVSSCCKLLLAGKEVIKKIEMPQPGLLSGRFMTASQIQADPLFQANQTAMTVLSYPIPGIPSNYHTVQFGFFCKQELQIEKATRIPFRFRLGSLAACNAIEGK